jgi:hypothetical protein
LLSGGQRHKTDTYQSHQKVSQHEKDSSRSGGQEKSNAAAESKPDTETPDAKKAAITGGPFQMELISSWVRLVALAAGPLPRHQLADG